MLKRRSRRQADGATPCYHFDMSAKPFVIAKRPPAPLSVAATAKKYRVSESVTKDIETFVKNLVSERGWTSKRRMGSGKAAGRRRRRQSHRAAAHR